MFILEKPQILYLLLLLIPMAAVFYWNLIKKKRQISRFGNEENLILQIPDYSVGKQHVKFVLTAIIYSLLVFCLANPQMGTSVQKVERKGIDVMVALDISNSMNCNDIQPSRLMRAKQAILRIIDKMESDRIGLVIFAGDAYLQLPLTTDYGAAKLFISNVETSDLSRQGTAIGSAIQLCVQNFDPKLENSHNKAIIVISDGENHEDDAVEAAREAARKGIAVYTVGMGSTQGAPIPIMRNGQVISYKKDLDGNVVITRLNRQMMEDIAHAGKGAFVEANNISSGVETVFEKLSHIDKVSFESRNISDYETRYQYFLALAIFLLILEIFIFEKRNRILNRRNLFGMKKNKGKRGNVLQVLLLFTILTTGIPSLAEAQIAIPTQKGNRMYQDSAFDKAEEFYSKALLADSNYSKARYNLGNTQYRKGNYTGAISQFERLKHDPTLNKDERADLLHNLGNSYMQQQEYEKAVENYVASLKEKPGREDTRYNLAYARKMLKKQQENQQNQQNQQQKQNQENNQQQNQQEQQNNQQQDKQDQNSEEKQEKKQQSNQKQGETDQQQQTGQPENQEQGKQKQPLEKAKKQEAERILRALENQEKNTLDKIKKKQNQDTGSPVEKDW